MRAWIAVGLMLIASPSLAGAQTSASDGKYARLFDEVWRTVDENFYDPSFHGVDWRATGDLYRARLAGVDTDPEFVALVAPMLRELKSSHVDLRAPAKSKVAEQSGPAARFREIGGARLVWRVAEGSDARGKGLRPGDRILSSPAEIYGPLGSTATLAIEGCGGERRSVAVRREQAFWPPAKPGFSWSTVMARPGSKIGYLRVDRFDDGADVLADQAMADLADTGGLIVDVRENSGGNMSAVRLGSYFSQGESPVVVLLSRPYLQALGRPLTPADVAAAPRVKGAYTTAAVFKGVADNRGGAAFVSEDMGAKRYTKPVVVLVGPNTGSAAEGFGWFMRLRTPARIVGQPSAAALLSGETFPLSEGWALTVPVHGLWASDGQSFADRPVQPHLRVDWTREDLCRGRDPDVAKALDLLLEPAGVAPSATN